MEPGKKSDKAQWRWALNNPTHKKKPTKSPKKSTGKTLQPNSVNKKKTSKTRKNEFS